ncbi:hypothetical protein KM043_014584 [Ampulex compressa]|nr:hypothetical protein KM043_014584 [Ampulex compressa]
MQQLDRSYRPRTAPSVLSHYCAPPWPPSRGYAPSFYPPRTPSRSQKGLLAKIGNQGRGLRGDIEPAAAGYWPRDSPRILVTLRMILGDDPDGPGDTWSTILRVERNGIAESSNTMTRRVASKNRGFSLYFDGNGVQRMLDEKSSMEFAEFLERRRVHFPDDPRYDLEFIRSKNTRARTRFLPLDPNRKEQIGRGTLAPIDARASIRGGDLDSVGSRNTPVRVSGRASTTLEDEPSSRQGLSREARSSGLTRGCFPLPYRALLGADGEKREAVFRPSPSISWTANRAWYKLLQDVGPVLRRDTELGSPR